jgi:TM2 domain-containing membrane protein YozV
MEIIFLKILKGERNMSNLKLKNPGLAAVLSLVIPGVGQFYNGTFWRGIFWLIVTLGLWIGLGGTLAWISHIIAAITAYNYAKRSDDDYQKEVGADFMKKEENFNILKDDDK